MTNDGVAARPSPVCASPPALRGDWRNQRLVGAAELVAGLRRLGVPPGGTVLVHSSLSRLGHVVGGADAVIDALLEAVGPTGTVLFPTLTGTPEDGPDHPPRVDMRTTPCWTGRIPESARQRPDARRSLHPTHSVAALGAASERYSSGHELGESPCDRFSPYYRLVEEEGFVLLLGVPQTANTTLHCVEELAGVPYHLQDARTTAEVIGLEGRFHRVRNRLHRWGLRRDFGKVDAPLAAAGALRIGLVGLAAARLVPARRMIDVLPPLLHLDPFYLLAPDSRWTIVRE